MGQLPFLWCVTKCSINNLIHVAVLKNLLLATHGASISFLHAGTWIEFTENMDAGFSFWHGVSERESGA